MDGKGQVSTLGLVIGLVVLIVVALALIMVVTGRIGGVGQQTGEQTGSVFDKIGTWISGSEIPIISDKGTTTTNGGEQAAGGDITESEIGGGL